MMPIFGLKFGVKLAQLDQSSQLIILVGYLYLKMRCVKLSLLLRAKNQIALVFFTAFEVCLPSHST